MRPSAAASKLAPSPDHRDDRDMANASAPSARRRAGLALVIGLAMAGLAGAPVVAWARSEKTLAYPRDQAWPTAVRFLVVDEHVRITEKDADAGYVLFELRDDRKMFRGSLELVSLVRDGRSVVRFVLQIADRPSWLEIAMLGRLETKLRAELGAPTPPAPEPPRKEPGKDPASDGSGNEGNPGNKVGSPPAPAAP